MSPAERGVRSGRGLREAPGHEPRTRPGRTPSLNREDAARMLERATGIEPA
jgi:hypothetical protein